MENDKNRRVLVIDDNRAVHDDFRKILSPNNTMALALEATEVELFGTPAKTPLRTRFETDSAYQGEEGLAKVRAALEAGRPYAIAFVDVRMPPGWDGVETTQKIWEIDSEIQIVLCTAYSDYSWDEMLDKIGNNDRMVILKKPFDTVEAFQLAHALTEKWWLHRQSRKKMEELESVFAERTRELSWKSAFLEAQINSSLDGILVVNDEGKKIYQNQRKIDLWKIPAHVADNVDDEQQVRFVMTRVKHPEQFASKVAYLYSHPNETSHDEVELIDDTVLDRYSYPIVGEDGKRYGRIWTFRDITHRKRMEAQLFQSQKLETVGKLAGGVAHEFNSIMTAIIGQSELMLNKLPADSPLAHNATEIRKAAERAAILTRQLLAYGRKQILQPKMLDLNVVIGGMESMLNNLLGGRVNLRINLGEGLYAVKADAGQIQQVILNLVINAGDAMPDGGQVTVETSNISFDPANPASDPNLAASAYVVMAVTDTGIGMEESVLAHIFDPFFSTKPIGEGTGLGLATCDGIIRQSGGQISVCSDPGIGTTFKVYLPAAAEAVPKKPRVSALDALPRGKETILLVEDDRSLREMAGDFLEGLGYSVLPAANGLKALTLAEQEGAIDLLLTDVVMPQMNGRELADKMIQLHPATKIVFTSAYTENAIVHQGILDDGIAFLQKPFTPSGLAKKLREVLSETKNTSKLVTS